MAEEQQQAGDRRHAGGIGKAAGGAVKPGHPFFKRLAGRVAGAAVVVAGALAKSRMAECSGLIDRDRHRPCSCVPLKADLCCLCCDVHGQPPK